MEKRDNNGSDQHCKDGEGNQEVNQNGDGLDSGNSNSKDDFDDLNQILQDSTAIK